MKTKNIFWGSVVLMLLSGLWSCIDDRGNYDYIGMDELFPVRISGFEDTAVVMRTRLKISPVLTGMDNEARYTHLWYAAPSVTAGFAPQRDTLSQTKDLDFEVTYESGTYNLVYELRDPKLDIYARKQVLLTVSSDVAGGWYVLKDQNDETDFDYLLMDGTKKADVLRAAGNQQLKGKAVKIVYQSGRYTPQITNPDGTVTTLSNKKALHVLSDSYLKVFNADNLELFKNFEGFFYETPAECKPQNCGYIGTDYYLMNAGKMYSIYGMSQNIGMCGYPKTGFYNLHQDMVLGGFAVTMFDVITNTFYSTTSSGALMNEFSEAPADGLVHISPTKMDATLVRLLTRVEGYTSTAYAVMKNPGKEEYYLGDMSIAQTAYPFVGFDTIPAGYEMPKAEVMGVPRIASCVYYAKGNVLKVYKNIENTEREFELKTFNSRPDEVISYIANFYYAPYQKPELNFNYLVVLTNSSTGWQMYRFNIVGDTPEIDPNPVLPVYSGSGTARYIMFRD